MNSIPPNCSNWLACLSVCTNAVTHTWNRGPQLVEGLLNQFVFSTRGTASPSPFPFPFPSDRDLDNDTWKLPNRVLIEWLSKAQFTTCYDWWQAIESPVAPRTRLFIVSPLTFDGRESLSEIPQDLIRHPKEVAAKNARDNKINMRRERPLITQHPHIAIRIRGRWIYESCSGHSRIRIHLIAA